MTDFYTTLDTLHDVLQDEIDTKQDTLTAGANITIDQTNTISATDTTYTAGTGIDITNNVISATGTGTLYARCTTAAATATKKITLTGHTLAEGDVINIRFSYSNSAASPAISVNSGTAYPIVYAGTNAINTYAWRAGQAVQFVFDGSYFIMGGGMANTTYWGLTKLSDSMSSSSTTVAATASTIKTLNDGKQDNLTAGTGIVIDGTTIGAKIAYGTCDTASATAAKEATITGWTPASGDLLLLYFANYNNASSPTLAINGGTAYPITMYSTDQSVPQYYWAATEVVAMTFTGNSFRVQKGRYATTTYYGPTKLYDGTDSTSTTYAATANSVKTAYDTAAAKQDALTAGDGIDITSNTISTKVDDATVDVNSSGQLEVKTTAGNHSTSSNPLDLNDITTTGFYRWYLNLNYCSNFPEDAKPLSSTNVYYYNMYVFKAYNTNRNIQLLICDFSQRPIIWMRTMASATTFSPWVHLDNPQAGTNISISSDNVISATDTTYTAGTGIDITDNVISATGTSGGPLYARCTTATATAAKEITLTGHTLAEGDVIYVRFGYGNSASSPTLSVNGGTAYPICYAGTSAMVVYSWRPGQAVPLVFDGTSFLMQGGIANTSYYGMTKLSSSLSSTSTSLAATASAVKSLNDSKQDNLTAGTNIQIDSDNVISATDTTYTAGTGISITDNAIAQTNTMLSTNYAASSVTDMNNYFTVGRYTFAVNMSSVANSPSDAPTSSAYYLLEVLPSGATTRRTQRLTLQGNATQGSAMWFRNQITASTYGSWYRISATAV